MPVGVESSQVGSIRSIAYKDGKVKIENSTKKSVMQQKLEDAGLVDSYGYIMPNKRKGDAGRSKISEKSARQNLASALLAVVADENERKVVQDYLAQVDKLDAAEAELHAINTELHKMLFTKGARDEARLQELQSKADTLTKQIDKADRKINGCICTMLS